MNWPLTGRSSPAFSYRALAQNSEFWIGPKTARNGAVRRGHCGAVDSDGGGCRRWARARRSSWHFRGAAPSPRSCRCCWRALQPALVSVRSPFWARKEPARTARVLASGAAQRCGTRSALSHPCSGWAGRGVAIFGGAVRPPGHAGWLGRRVSVLGSMRAVLAPGAAWRPVLRPMPRARVIRTGTPATGVAGRRVPGWLGGIRAERLHSAAGQVLAAVCAANLVPPWRCELL